MHLQQIFSSTNDSLQMIFSAQGKQEKYYLFGLSWWYLWSSLGDVGDVVVDGGGVSCGFDGVVSVVVVADVVVVVVLISVATVVAVVVVFVVVVVVIVVCLPICMSIHLCV